MGKGVRDFGFDGFLCRKELVMIKVEDMMMCYLYILLWIYMFNDVKYFMEVLDICYVLIVDVNKKLLGIVS